MQPRYFYTLEGILIVLLTLTLFLNAFWTLPGNWQSALLGTVMTLGVLPVFWSVWQAIRERNITVDVLAGLALLFSLISQEWSSALFIALMLSAARIMTYWNDHRTEHNLESLMKLRPENARVRRGDTFVEVAVADLVVGDIVVCEVGSRIPVDGQVVVGNATVDESSLTGESIPVEKEVGSAVYSSTLMVSGSIELRAEKVGGETTLERIIALVTQAREDKPVISTAAERFGKIYILSIFFISAGIWLFTQDLRLVLAIALVVCADDVAIAIPLAYISAIGAAARQGVIIKGGRYLEAFGSIQTVVFDKTGTLTKGVLQVQSIQSVEPERLSRVLELASVLAERSHHPVSRAIAKVAKERGTIKPVADMSSYEEVSGRGMKAVLAGVPILVGRSSFLAEAGAILTEAVQAMIGQMENEGLSVVLVAEQGAVVGALGVMDTIRPGARETLEKLRALGVSRLVMLSGDNDAVVRRVAKAVGITEYHAALLPGEKLQRIETLTAECPHGTVMVGDGVNDAASLERATVGVAMGAIGYDAAIESANIVLMHDDITKLPEIVLLSRKLKGVVRQDFAIWGISNVIGLGLVFAGVLGPTGAAAYNFLSDFVPLLNSLRVVRLRLGEDSAKQR